MQTTRLGLLTVVLGVVMIGSACNMPSPTPPSTPRAIAPTNLSNMGAQSILPPLCNAPAYLKGDVNTPVISCISNPTYTVLGKWCQQGWQYVNINVAPAAQSPKLSIQAWTDDVPDDYSKCSLADSNNGTLVTCWGHPSDTASIDVDLQCKLNDNIQPTCPSGYQYDPNLKYCIFKGSTEPLQTQCDQGETYDPARHCCQNSAGLYLGLCGNDYTNWDVGANQNNQYVYYCVPAYQVSAIASEFSYDFAACTNPQPKNPQSVCSPKTCPPSFQWDQNSCSCEYVPG